MNGHAPVQKRVVIVGAGVGGISLAARLSQIDGISVSVYEKNDYHGGRCSLIHGDGGYRFDRGPSLLLLPKLFEEAFADLGTSLKAEGVELLKCDPNYHVHFGDGESMRLSTDLVDMKREIERFEGVDGFEGFLGFMQESHRHYEHSVDHVLHRNFYSLFSMLRPSFLPYVQQLHPFEALYKRASIYFKTDRMRRAFTFAAMYMGMSPIDCPATYSLLQYTEIAEGIWYPRHGFNKVIQALVAVGERTGVKLNLSTPVKRVIVSDDGRATGIELENGKMEEADLVVVNADLVYAYEKLLPKSKYAEGLTKRQSSCSSISFYWAVDRQVKELGVHNIFLADDYEESFDSIFKDHTMPREPSFYINVPSRVDPTAAPEGCDSVVVLVPIGHITDGKTKQDFDALVNRARAHVFKVLAKQLGLKDFPSYIKQEFYNDPYTWREDLNLSKGSILGLSHDFFNVLSFRPKTKHGHIKDLFFVGASAHPGTGVPIVLAGAKMVAEQILEELGIKPKWKPWSRVYAAAKGDQTAKLDLIQSKGILQWLWPLLALFMGIIAVFLRS